MANFIKLHKDGMEICVNMDRVLYIRRGDEFNKTTIVFENREIIVSEDYHIVANFLSNGLVKTSTSEALSLK